MAYARRIADKWVVCATKKHSLGKTNYEVKPKYVFIAKSGGHGGSCIHFGKSGSITLPVDFLGRRFVLEIKEVLDSGAVYEE